MILVLVIDAFPSVSQKQVQKTFEHLFFSLRHQLSFDEVEFFQQGIALQAFLTLCMNRVNRRKLALVLAIATLAMMAARMIRRLGSRQGLTKEDSTSLTQKAVDFSARSVEEAVRNGQPDVVDTRPNILFMLADDLGRFGPL